MGTDRNLHTYSIVLACLGLVDALYLTYVKISHTFALCGPLGDCESVNTSQYSEIAGIPISILGAAAYFLILVFLVMEPRASFWTDNSPLVVFGISLVGVLYSAYLTYIEISVLKAICPYCVGSAVVMVLLLVLAIVRLVKVQEDEFQTDMLIRR
jgi:uncharacterized membrane protein